MPPEDSVDAPFSDPEKSAAGFDALDAFLSRMARVHFEMSWVVFGMGQAGAAHQLSDNPEVTAKLLEQFMETIEDLEAACTDLIAVCHALHMAAIEAHKEKHPEYKETED